MTYLITHTESYYNSERYRTKKKAEKALENKGYHYSKNGDFWYFGKDKAFIDESF